MKLKNLKVTLISCLALTLCACSGANNTNTPTATLPDVAVDKVNNPYTSQFKGIFNNSSDVFLFTCESEGGISQITNGAVEELIKESFIKAAAATDNNIIYSTDSGIYVYSLLTKQTELVADDISAAAIFVHGSDTFIRTTSGTTNLLVEGESELYCISNEDFSNKEGWTKLVGADSYENYSLYYVENVAPAKTSSQLAAITAPDGWEVSFSYDGSNYVVENDIVYEIDYSHNGRLNPETFAEVNGDKAYYIYQFDDGKSHNPVEHNFSSDYLDHDELDCLDVVTNTNEVVYKAAKPDRIIGFDMNADVVYLFADGSVRKHGITDGSETVVAELETSDSYSFGWANGTCYVYYLSEDGTLNIKTFN